MRFFEKEKRMGALLVMARSENFIMKEEILLEVCDQTQQSDEVAHACNPSYLRSGDIGGSWFKASLGKS
jgi:hypothetical protein